MLPILVDSTPVTSELRNLHWDVIPNGVVGQQHSEAGPQGHSMYSNTLTTPTEIS